MKQTTRDTGNMGEQLAAGHLQSKGYAVLEMNFKNNVGRRLGEIDIIAKEKKTGEIVFVEVKSREYEGYGNTLPEENITPRKLRKLAKIASAYLFIRGLQDAAHRFDAISVWIDGSGNAAKIKHIQGL